MIFKIYLLLCNIKNYIDFLINSILLNYNINIFVKKENYNYLSSEEDDIDLKNCKNENNEKEIIFYCVKCRRLINNELFVINDKYFCSKYCRFNYSSNNLIN